MIHRDQKQELNSPAALEVLAHPLVVKARESALTDFAGVYRKVPTGWEHAPAPYFEHVEAVAIILALHGYGPDVVAAGYLHDHLEDLPHLWSRERMAREFSPRVAELVDWVTQQDKSLSWEERNSRYNERLENAPDEAKAISCADKISNVSDTLPYLRLGFPIKDLLKRGWAPNSEKLHKLLCMFEGHITAKMTEQLSDLLYIFDETGKLLEEAKWK